MKNQKPSLIKKVIKNQYQLSTKLKTGGFGSVYLARSLKNSRMEYAVKVIPPQHKQYADIQCKMYDEIKNNKYTSGFIQNIEFYDENDYRFIVMELLGKDLDDLMNNTKAGKFSIKTCLMIALQLIDRIQALHGIGYLHRDVKPDNLAIGLKEKKTILYLFDFGLAIKIGSLQPKAEKGKMIGTLGFMSARSHESKQPLPSDDLESFVYTILYLIHGTLPWMNIKIINTPNMHKILLMKNNINKNSFKHQTPKQMWDILSYVRTINKNQEPDYLKIKYKLMEALKNIHENNDFLFDWCQQKFLQNHKNKSIHKIGEFIDKVNKDIKIKQDKQQIIRKKQQNQQIVQNEIYEVYKFMQIEKKQKIENITNKQFKKKQQVHKQYQQKMKYYGKMKKPVSAMHHKPINNKVLDPMNTEIFQQLGPKIVINKTVKYKI